ncbi:radical SAM protein [Micromonospora sp. CPCC 205546]|uniref:radical SAM protein n=1 Tax=Micromonospora sp. CPCC 205546 TaxID=3122397 RepID=UPI002FF19C0B
MITPDRPTNVIWDVTYACPLRCTHCYSESGRRPSRQLGREDMLRVADAIVSLRPDGVALAGGEPLLVKGIFEVAERISRADIPVVLYTGGWSLAPWMVEAAQAVLSQVVVSIDGATAEVHDRIRGRAGSFDRAMHALSLLDEAVRDRRARGERSFSIGIDYVVVRSNFHQIEDMCTTVAPRFRGLGYLTFGAAVPAGLASRPSFGSHELLTDGQVDLLGDPAQTRRLQSLAPPSVQVTTNDNRILQMHPELLARGMVFSAMQVEPDGAVRAMPIYEGTVGNLLTDPPADLWRRAVTRWADPFVTRTLGPVRSMAQWAEAARRIDYHFGSNDVRARIDRRPAYSLPVSGGQAL